jgi:hypothetical protein
MVRGVTLNWKQVMGYFLTDHCLKASQVGHIVEEATRILKRAGLHVVGVVMDQGST